MFGSVDINSYNNKNPAIPDIYPTHAVGDATYEHPEDHLRSAIFIPKDFKYGKDGKTPVILVPGTGSLGGEAFSHNFAKLLTNSTFGDPVWLNIKGHMNDHSHKNAEHVAYAIHYMYAACKKPTAIAAWSQGNLATQWAFKYWPSTRKAMNNFIALSADFNGTWQASVVMPLKIGLMNPSAWAQKQHSQFIQALRDDGGDSAYVPTTSVYSAVDEVVQPQYGDNASAIMHDACGVGARNYQLQKVAYGEPAGSYYTHATVLSNPITWALASDAIRNGGPGQIERIDLTTVQSTFTAEGLSTVDAIATAAMIPKCGFSIVKYFWKVTSEPEVPAYAVKQMKKPLQKISVQVTDAKPSKQIPADELPPPAAELPPGVEKA